MSVLLGRTSLAGSPGRTPSRSLGSWANVLVLIETIIIYGMAFHAREEERGTLTTASETPDHEIGVVGFSLADERFSKFFESLLT